MSCAVSLKKSSQAAMNLHDSSADEELVGTDRRAVRRLSCDLAAGRGYFASLGSGIEAWPKTYRHPAGVRT